MVITDINNDNIYIYTCLFRQFWQSIKKRKNTIKYSGFVPW